MKFFFFLVGFHFDDDNFLDLNLQRNNDHGLDPFSYLDSSICGLLLLKEYLFFDFEEVIIGPVEIGSNGWVWTRHN